MTTEKQWRVADGIDFIVRRISLIVFVVATSVGAVRAADDAKPGLIAEYYEFNTGLADFPVITPEKKPTIRRVEKQIMIDDCSENFNNTNLNTNFCARWTGSVKIDKAGKYKFFLESDDGSRLYLDGKLVLDNGSTHGMAKKECELELKPGQHDIKVDFFQGDGGMGCKFTWLQPGKGEEPVNENSLWHKADLE